MAFNPFESFRNNSKMLIAIMALICMFTFVLSSGLGKGDAFEWFLGQFGGGGPAQDEIATYFGKPIKRSELDHLRRGRAAANIYMFEATHLAGKRVFQLLERDVLSKTKINDPDVLRAFTDFFKAQKQQETFTKDTTPQEKTEVRRQIQQAVSSLQQLYGKLDEKTKAEEFKAMNKLITALQNEDRYNESGRSGGMYFLTAPNNNELDALEFDLMLRKADQMGFKYTEDQVANLIAIETDNALTEQDAANVENHVRATVRDRTGPMSSSDLVQALGNEFRARSMVAILRGDRITSYEQLTAQPIGMAPWDFYKYYRDQCSESTFRLIDVPVETFLPQVKQEPTEAELKALFSKNSKREASPDSEQLGFKQPNRALFEYVELDSKAPYYEKITPLTQAASTIAAGLTQTMLGGGFVPSAMTVAQPFIAAHLPIEEKVQKKVKDAQAKGFPASDLFRFLDALGPNGVRFRDNIVYHPLPFAALASQLAFPGTLANFTGAAANQYQLMAALDARDRVKAGLPAFLAGFGWGGLPDAVAPPFPLMALVPAAVGSQVPVPTAVYRQEILAADRQDKLQKLFRQDQEDFVKKLKDFGAKLILAKPGTADTEENKEKRKKSAEIKAEAQKYIDEFVKDRGFHVYRSAKLDDRFDVANDPAMKPLIAAGNEAKEVAGKENPPITVPSGDTQLEKLFDSTGPVQGENPLYSPVSFPKYDDPTIKGTLEKNIRKQYLVWRTEDLPAKAYTQWELLPQHMKDRVVLAWKLQRARDLAKTQADALAENLRKWAGPELEKSDNFFDSDHSPFGRRLLDELKQIEGEQHLKYRSFVLSGIAPLKRERTIGNNGMGGMMNSESLYVPPQVPTQEIRYPGAKMIPELLEARNKPLGATLVLNDAPKMHYYVACLVQRNEKDMKDFISRVFFRSVVPNDTKIQFMSAERRAEQFLDMNRGGPAGRDEFIVKLFKNQAAEVLKNYDPLLFPTAEKEKLIPDFRKDFVERLKAEGNFTANEEELKKLEGKDRNER